MKHLKGFLRLSLVTLCLLAWGSASALDTDASAPDEAPADSSISLSLITCQPGQESWSLYGHTAIHYVNRARGIDVAVNYGMFNFRKPHFVLRFVFGLTDYEMGIQPYDAFCATYAYERRGIIEQEITALTPRDKAAIALAIEENYLPENREYRYNIFYDNCTTRARDMLLRTLRDTTHVDFGRSAEGPSFRALTHQYTAGHPWVQLGNDLLLGVKADRPTSVSEQQFLPYNLMDDFDRALVGPMGSPQQSQTAVRLAAERRVVVPMFEHEPGPKAFPLGPKACAWLLAIGVVILTLVEWLRKHALWGFDLVLLLPIGLSGLVLTAMVFSQHPTVNLNLQILLLNPLALLCLVPVVLADRKRRSHWFWATYGICLLLFLAGNAAQCYAEGTNILALSLLFRSVERTFLYRSVNRKPSILK